MNRGMFNRDLQNEQVLAQYLDLYFYTRIVVENTTRIADINAQQYAGIDITFDYNNKRYLVDEKGYLTKPTIQNTFVLELSFINPQGQRIEGWFYNPEKHTTHYLLCWADREPIKIYKEDLTIDHFKRVEVMLVNRFILQNYLNQRYGINREYIYTNHQFLLNQTAIDRLFLPNSKSRYTLSKGLPEQPLNLVMTKQEYIASGAVESRFMVYRDRINPINN